MSYACQDQERSSLSEYSLTVPFVCHVKSIKNEFEKSKNAKIKTVPGSYRNIQQKKLYAWNLHDPRLTIAKNIFCLKHGYKAVIIEKT